MRGRFIQDRPGGLLLEPRRIQAQKRAGQEMLQGHRVLLPPLARPGQLPQRCASCASCDIPLSPPGSYWATTPGSSWPAATTKKTKPGIPHAQNVTPIRQLRQLRLKLQYHSGVHSAWTTWKTQEEQGGARSLEDPGGARISQEQPGAWKTQDFRSSQGAPGESRGTQQEPGEHTEESRRSQDRRS